MTHARIGLVQNDRGAWVSVDVVEPAPGVVSDPVAARAVQIVMGDRSDDVPGVYWATQAEARALAALILRAVDYASRAVATPGGPPDAA